MLRLGLFLALIWDHKIVDCQVLQTPIFQRKITVSSKNQFYRKEPCSEDHF